MKITHRQVGTTGTLWGVEFVNGVGHTDDPETLAKLQRQGHKIEPEDTIDDRTFVDPPDPEADIDDRTFADPDPDFED